ncbi:LytR/AlgR family response regulator transcription factor [Pseudazoarcus pumilus]|uniref:DNA-binding response regulator n=1 Tax=Pseudazoarcus pumilus TaxID=2067960 RepID=A0A2I6S4K1_9RHOO|nr:LytTR family DNA-binding domain-containing protein [Pseudazoarcus pumilus]AUN94168.1 DNA-binding response regulator [Pseudazoarcus pumilus]
MVPKVPLRILIVDDEAPARARLRDLLGDIAAEQPSEIVGVAANGVEALRLIEAQPVDVVLADVRMPAMDGVELARRIGAGEDAPHVIFTTAYDEHAVEAFELAATDYLVKPVRASRLAEALGRARARMGNGGRGVPRRNFSVSERGRIVLVPIAEVVLLRAEMKYVTAITTTREYVLDESLVQIEQEFPERFLRVHRNCLVARDAVAGVERAGEVDGEAHWDVLLRGLHERVPISRRQWPTVREALRL